MSTPCCSNLFQCFQWNTAIPPNFANDLPLRILQPAMLGSKCSCCGKRTPALSVSTDKVGETEYPAPLERCWPKGWIRLHVKTHLNLLAKDLLMYKSSQFCCLEFCYLGKCSLWCCRKMHVGQNWMFFFLFGTGTAVTRQSPTEA